MPSSPFTPGPGPTSPYASSAHPSYPGSPTSPTSQRSGPGTPGPGPSSRIPITIVGNKRDQVSFREVSTDEGRQLAQKLGCDFYEASAKTNTNVEASFKSLVRQIKAQRRGEAGGGGPGFGGPGGGVGAGGAGYGAGAGIEGSRRKRKKCVIL